MSLVGPRPCLPYETALFEPHHFERFLVPAGMTGLWQVSARARTTFREALDLDAAYVRGWSLGLDLRLLSRTPSFAASERGDGVRVRRKVAETKRVPRSDRRRRPRLLGPEPRAGSRAAIRRARRAVRRGPSARRSGGAVSRACRAATSRRCSRIAPSTPSRSRRRSRPITRWPSAALAAGKHVFIEKPLAPRSPRRGI